MNRTAQTSIIIALVALIIWAFWKRGSRNNATNVLGNLEYFTPESPPPSGSHAASTLNSQVVPPVSSTNLGISDSSATPAPALNSTQATLASIVKPPETLIPYADASTTASTNMSNANAVEDATDTMLSEKNGYDSMFDTKLIPSWTIKDRNGNVNSDTYLDGTVLQQPTTQAVIFKIPNNPRAGAVTKITAANAAINKALVGIDSRGMAKFSNLVECNQRNYLTAQNFWEYNYKYPIVPPEGSSPLGANYAHEENLQNPMTEFKIIAANKDGGQPYPVNSFFLPL